MQRFVRAIKKEWEKAACVSAAVLLGVFLLVWALAEPRPLPALRAGKLPSHEALFRENAFAYMSAPPVSMELAKNPFRFEMQTGPSTADAREEQPPAPPVAEPEAPAESAEAKPPEEAPDGAAGSGDEAAAEPAEAPSRPRVRLLPCMVKFVFYHVNQSGKPVALIELRNPARPDDTPLARTVSVGDTLLGTRIMNLGAQAVTVVDAARRRHRIALGDEQRVAIRLASDE